MEHVGDSRVTLHWTYLEIACLNLKDAKLASASLQRLESHHAKLVEKLQQWGEERASKIYPKWMEARRQQGTLKGHGIISAIVFSGLILEAYINSIARQRLSRFFRENLDKLDLSAKWVVITKEAFGTGVQPQDVLIERINLVQKMRNLLVHAKPIHWKCEQTALAAGNDPAAKYRIGFHRAEAAIETCFTAIKAIRDLDPEYDRHGHDFFRKNIEPWVVGTANPHDEYFNLIETEGLMDEMESSN